MPLCLLTTHCRKLFVALLLQLLQTLLDVGRTTRIIPLLDILWAHIGGACKVASIQLCVASLRAICELIRRIPERIRLRKRGRRPTTPRLQLTASLRNLSRRRGPTTAFTPRSRRSRWNLTTCHGLRNPRLDLLRLLDILRIGNLQRRHLLQKLGKLLALHSINTHRIDQRGLLHGIQSLQDLATRRTTIAVEQCRLAHSLLGILKKRKRIQRNGCEYCHADPPESSRDGQPYDL